MRARVLVVDDEETIRKLLKGRLEREGCQVSVASNADEGEKTFTQSGDVGVVVTDLKMPGKDGLAFMKWVKEQNPSVKAVMITGHGEKDVAIQALRQGASDYLEKPFDLEELTHAVKRGLREFTLERENQDLVSRLEARVERVEGKTEDKFWYVSKCASMTKVNEWISVLRREAMRGGGEEPSVLILGESGTGKEGIARMIHAGSRRGKGPWVAVNCANFSEQLLESELFGHERGAFTGANTLKRGLFEIAKGGTLFLDEIGEMDPKLQASLLRVLQEKTFRRVGGSVDNEADVRVIAATNRDLASRVSSGKFREDLYHRLNRVIVEIPALRDRGEDILPMAKQFAERAFSSRTKSFPGFTTDAELGLAGYRWPGNVRELLNVIERSALLHTGSRPITMSDLAIQGGTSSNSSNGESDSFTPNMEVSSGDLAGGYMDLKKRWSDAFEKEYLIASLRKHQGNVSAAAREARVDRSNFLRLLRRHMLKAQDYRKVGSAPETATGTNIVKIAA